jgi:hypothetical protein
MQRAEPQIFRGSALFFSAGLRRLLFCAGLATNKKYQIADTPCKIQNHAVAYRTTLKKQGGRL